MGDFRNMKYTPNILREYSEAALKNARELVAEAALLYAHRHIPRAFFLAVAAIEEIGKALIAFDGQGRNLEDSAVTAKLKRRMEDHSEKITAGLSVWILAGTNKQAAVMPAVDLIIKLKYGREPSMYTDIQQDSARIQMPAAVVRKIAARDCIRLAKDCLILTEHYLGGKVPEPSTPAQDQVFAMKSTQYQKVVLTADFWWYYIDQVASGEKDYAQAVIEYQRKYLKKGKKFKKSTSESEAKLS